LASLDECRQVAELERTIWEYTTSDDVVPPPVLIVSIKRGGILIGAFDDAGEMKGFVYSMPAIRDGRPTQWSHMLGVTPDARGTGLGIRLKLAQREAAFRMGVDLIEWTFDPLQAVNAHLNFAKLGVVANEYVENLYGASNSSLHAGAPTDRFIVEWKLREPHVVRRVAALSGPVARDGSVSAAPIVNPIDVANDGPRPGAADLRLEDRRVMVAIPLQFTTLLQRDPELALEWRLATRQIFVTYFARGYRAVDFFLGRTEGYYLLATT